MRSEAETAAEGKLEGDPPPGEPKNPGIRIEPGRSGWGGWSVFGRSVDLVDEFGEAGASLLLAEVPKSAP